MLTFLGIHRRRGVEATDELGVLRRFEGVLVHDRRAPYWRYTNAQHADLRAHLLRDLAAVAEVATQAPWADQMAALLVDAKRKAEAAAAAGHPTMPRGQRAHLRARYNRLLTDAFNVNPD